MGGRFPTLLLVVALAVGAGCGKKGAPLPPRPRGPLPAREVAARQLGDRVLVGFRVAEPRGAKTAQQPVRAELIRVSYGPGIDPPADPDAFRRRGEAVGEIAAGALEPDRRLLIEDGKLDQLPERGRGFTLRYAVRVRDARGRSSLLAVAPDLVPVPPAEAPGPLGAEPTAEGVRLSWSPPGGNAALRYNVYRTAPGSPWPEKPVNAEPVEGTQYLDTAVQAGSRYVYTLRVALGVGEPYREGEPSQPCEVTAEDRFAPAAPRGLVAVQEGRAVRLFWDPSPERDVAGYRVWRQDEGGEWRRIGPDPVRNPQLLDAEVDLDGRPRYRVTAVDRADPPNESEPSAAVEPELHAEPATLEGAGT